MRSSDSFLFLLVLVARPLVSSGFAGLSNADLIQKYGGAKTMKERKLGKLPINTLAKHLEKELREKEWFVTGKVDPRYFCSDFVYEDADVKLSSLDEYAVDVRALFDQEVSKAEVVRTDVDSEDNVITCTWRLSGKANVLWGLDIKPCYVYTDYYINPKNGLIQHQEDRYSVPQWDMVLSAIFPFLNGILTAPAAPPVARTSAPKYPNNQLKTHEPKIKKQEKVPPPDPIIKTPSENVVKPIDAYSSRAGIMSYFASVSTPVVARVQEVAEPIIAASTSASVSSSSPVGSGTVQVEPARSRSYQNVEHATPPELVAYSDVVVSHPNKNGHHGTQVITVQEMEQVTRGGDSPLHELLNFVQDTLNGHKQDIPWHAVVSSSSSSSGSSESKEPEIRAILSDGTKIPAIRAPSWRDRAKNYIPDRASTRANLEEATRRAESRRYFRWYEEGEKTEKSAQHTEMSYL